MSNSQRTTLVINKTIKLSELCFCIFWILLQIGKGMGYTSRHEEFRVLLICGIPFALLRLILMKWDQRSLLVCIALNCLGLASAYFSKTTTYMLSIVCITAAKNMDIKKLLKLVLVIRGPLFVVRTTLAFLGYLDMEEMYRYSEGVIVKLRYALGYGHANTAQYELFMLILVFFFLYENRLRLFHFLLAFIYNQFMFQYTDSKTSYYLCIIFLLAVFVCYRGNDNIIRKIATLIATKSWLFGITITFFGCLAYQYVPVFRTLGNFSSRFLTATRMIAENPLLPFGMEEIITDLGYVYLLYSGGMVLFVLFFWGINKLMKQRFVVSDIVLLLIFACFSVFNIMESSTYSVLSNCFLLFLVYVIYPPTEYRITMNSSTFD